MNDETATLDFGLKTADYAAIVAYLLVTAGISLWFGRKQKDVDDYFVGGRRMPWFAVGLSILATLFSTLSYLGVPGEVIKHGIGLFTGYLSLPLTASVILFLWIPFFMRLRVTSAYEYLELRFDRSVRWIGAGLFVLLRLGWMSMVVYAASLALDRVKGPDLAALPGPDLFWWIAIIGVVAAIYTSIGGIQSVIWIDVLQCILLLAGVLLAIGYVALNDGTGPVDWWTTATAHRPSHTSPPLFSFDVTTRVTVAFVMFNNFFWTICTHGSDQVVLQRYFSTASMQAARRSYLINVCVDLTMAALMATAGLALLAFYLRHSSLLPDGATDAMAAADKLFPHFLGSQLPAGCAGLIISAFLCDAIQTLESGVNAITAVLTNDFLKRPQAEENDGDDLPAENSHELAVARVTTIGITAFVTMAAFGVAWLQQTQKLTIVDMMPKFFNMFVGPLASLFFIGMFLPRCTKRSAITAVLVSLSLSVLWSWWKEIFHTDYAPSPFLAIGIPYIASVACAVFLSAFAEPDEPQPGRNFTWWNVVRRGNSENETE